MINKGGCRRVRYRGFLHGGTAPSSGGYPPCAAAMWCDGAVFLPKAAGLPASCPPCIRSLCPGSGTGGVLSPSRGQSIPGSAGSEPLYPLPEDVDTPGEPWYNHGMRGGQGVWEGVRRVPILVDSIISNLPASSSRGGGGEITHQNGMLVRVEERLQGWWGKGVVADRPHSVFE